MINFNLIDGGLNQVFKLKVLDCEEEIGYFLLIPQAINIYEVHTHFEPVAYGSSVPICKEALNFVFSTNPDIDLLVTKVPVNNPLAKRLTIKSGFIQYGILPDSFMVDNKLIDQELFYINKGIVLCQ